MCVCPCVCLMTSHHRKSHHNSAWWCPLRAKSSSKFYIINQHYQTLTGQLRISPTVLAACSNSPNISGRILSSLISEACWLECRERGRKRNRDKKKQFDKNHIVSGILIFLGQSKTCLKFLPLWLERVSLTRGLLWTHSVQAQWRVAGRTMHHSSYTLTAGEPHTHTVMHANIWCKALITLLYVM